MEEFTSFVPKVFWYAILKCRYAVNVNKAPLTAAYVPLKESDDLLIPNSSLGSAVCKCCSQTFNVSRHEHLYEGKNADLITIWVLFRLIFMKLTQRPLLFWISTEQCEKLWKVLTKLSACTGLFSALDNCFMWINN